jgi:lambda family phage portal protein
MAEDNTAPNLIDRLVGWFDPSAGLRRVGARRALALAAPPYEAATPSRTRKFYTDQRSPNQLVDLSARALRAQARQLQRNHDVSRGILRTMVNNVVGANGISIEPQPRRADGTIHDEYAAALRAAWREWILRPEVTGRHHWSKVQRLMCMTWLRDGESFAQEVLGVAGYAYPTAVPLALEMFEADLVPFDYEVTPRIDQGIERNAWGRPIAYFVHKHHPADGIGPGLSFSTADLKRVSAERVHHIALLDRIGQMRGISEFASIITRLEDIKDYEESERIAAKIAAALTAYVKKTSPDGYQGPVTDSAGNPAPRSISMAPGMVIDSLTVGEEIGLIDSNRPNPNVVTFRQGQLRAVAAGVGASYSSIARDYGGTYSAQRQELVEQWVNYATLTDEFVGQFIQPVWASFVAAATLSRAVPVPRDVQPGTEDDALFLAQSMPWIDPAKEAAAYLALVRAGFASEVEVMRKRGVNPRDVLEQITTFRAETAARDLVFTSDGRNSEAGGASPDADQITDTATQAATRAAEASARLTQQDIARLQDAVQAQARAQAAPAPAAAPVNVHLGIDTAQVAQMAQEVAGLHRATLSQIREDIQAMPVVIPAPQVTVEAIMPAVRAEAPQVTVNVEPAAVTVVDSHPTRSVQTVERDANDEITRTVTTYER